MTVMAANSREGKVLQDVIFSSGQAAREAAKKYGQDAVVNATIGCYYGDDEKIACLPVVEKVYRSLPMADFITYAPPVGLPDYRQAVVDEVFADCRPAGYTGAVATAGGTGALHIGITNYSEVGDQVLTTDWHWNIYDNLCDEIGRKMTTFSMLDEAGNFNQAAFADAMAKILQVQDSLLLIFNTPANNPTGFALSDEDWDGVLATCRAYEKQGKRLTLLVDIAYIAYAGEKNAVRSFMKRFSQLPEQLLVLFAFSMSKGYTLYGQRAGALVGLSMNKAAIDELTTLGKYSARTAWSNVNRAAMTLLTRIHADQELTGQLDAERLDILQHLRRRSAIFTAEADDCGLAYLPYKGGFFLSLPVKDAKMASQALEKELVFAAPLAKGIRLGICSIPEKKMKGLAGKIKRALATIQ